MIYRYFCFQYLWRILCFTFSLLLFNYTCFFVQKAQAQESSGFTQENRSIDLVAYALKKDILFNWDNFLGLGLLTKNESILSFSIDTPYVLVNFEKKIEVVPPIIKNGSLFVDDSFITVLSNELLKSSSTKTNSVLVPRSSSYYEQFQISTIIIDPGHGGKDPGAVGVFSTSVDSQKRTVKEKDIVLRTALMLGKYLKDVFPTIEIEYTRDTDVFLSLEKRAEVANEVLDKLTEDEAALFISIHANGSLKKKANGMEVWTLPPDYTRNNLVLDIELDETSPAYDIINTIRDQEISLESQQLAEMVLTKMYGSLDGIIRNRGVKQEKWYVVRNTRMPAILLELGFVTNESESALLDDEEILTKLTMGIAEGVSNYIRLFQR